ncbi:MAG: HEAT repeat domain-containing protein [Candidatus Omnitrophota bacterium]
MHYKDKSLGFSFDLPEGWHHDEHNLTLTFFGPNGHIGYPFELIQMQIGTILPRYLEPESREKFLAEPGAEVLRCRLGNETNVVVLKKASDTEISVVHDEVQYTIAHSNDEATQRAVDRLKESFRFPSVEEAVAAIQRSNDPQKQAILRALKSGSPEQARHVLSEAGMPPVIERPGYTMHRVGTNTSTNGQKKRLSVPQLGRSYDIPERILNPYTQAEMGKKLPKLKGKSLFVDFQKDIDGPQTATRLIRETLAKCGVSWVENTNQAEAVIWIQGGSGAMRFAFVVAHPEDSSKFLAAECGPRELTATIMTAVSEYFSSTGREAPKGELSKLIVHVNELNRAITGAALAQDWTKSRQLMAELRVAVVKLGSIGEAEAVKPVVDVLADSAGAYENTGFSEAKALREAAIETLQKIGKDSIPWIKEGLTHSNPVVRSACNRALKACGGKPWWQFW